MRCYNVKIAYFEILRYFLFKKNFHVKHTRLLVNIYISGALKRTLKDAEILHLMALHEIFFKIMYSRLREHLRSGAFIRIGQVIM